MNTMDDGRSWKIFKVIVGLMIAFFLLISLNSLFERVDAGGNLVVQSVFGNQTVYTDAGYKWQGFGKVTHYKKSFQEWFKANQGEVARIRFNDGGHADVSGSVRVDLPSDNQKLLEIHKIFGGQEAVEKQLVRTVIEKSIYMTGPLMSSKESYAEKRNDMINFIEDQAANGVYQTVPKETETVDIITGEKKRLVVVDIKRGDDGKFLRQEESPLVRFGVKLYNLALNEIKYDATVEKQIAAQQEAIMNVQTAIANAKRAEQDALTTAKQGEATAAKAKWEQESINAKLIAEAEGRKRAAELDKQSAEFTKQREILLGEGEAKRKQLVMEADGALEKKLDAFIRVNTVYAEALSKMQVPVVPSVMMGNDGKNTVGSAAELIEMIKAKTALDLSLDMNVKKK